MRAEYTITVEGRLDDRWSESFDGLEVLPQDDGTTNLRGRFCDQSALFGHLRTVQRMGLTLIRVDSVRAPR